MLDVASLPSIGADVTGHIISISRDWIGCFCSVLQWLKITINEQGEYGWQVEFIGQIRM